MQVFLTHVVPGVAVRAMVLKNDQLIPTAVDGVSLTTSIEDDQTFIVSPPGVRPQLTTADVNTCAAVVHVTNAVLTLAGPSLLFIDSAFRRFSIRPDFDHWTYVAQTCGDRRLRKSTKPREMHRVDLSTRNTSSRFPCPTTATLTATRCSTFTLSTMSCHIMVT